MCFDERTFSISSRWGRYFFGLQRLILVAATYPRIRPVPLEHPRQPDQAESPHRFLCSGLLSEARSLVRCKLTNYIALSLRPV